MITSLQGRDDHDKVEVVDATYWIKGCSSLGPLRFAVLVGVYGKKRDNEHFSLVDIKEAVRAAAPRCVDVLMPRDYGERVVEGARKLSSFLGQRMRPWHFLGQSVVLRELLPQDLKLEMDQLTREDAITAARFLASVVGKAHSSQLDNKARAQWLKTLRGSRGKKNDAPSWLWASVVDLVASHETAYLEHCREYAIGAA